MVRASSAPSTAGAMSIRLFFIVPGERSLPTVASCKSLLEALTGCATHEDVRLVILSSQLYAAIPADRHVGWWSVQHVDKHLKPSQGVVGLREVPYRKRTALALGRWFSSLHTTHSYTKDVCRSRREICECECTRIEIFQPQNAHVDVNVGGTGKAGRLCRCIVIPTVIATTVVSLACVSVRLNVPDVARHGHSGEGRHHYVHTNAELRAATRLI